MLKVAGKAGNHSQEGLGTSLYYSCAGGSLILWVDHRPLILFIFSTNVNVIFYCTDSFSKEAY